MSSEEIVKEVNLSAALNGYDEYFHTKKYVFNNNEYTIIKYDKEKLNSSQKMKRERKLEINKRDL